MNPLRTLKDLDLDGRRALLRLDLNVPLRDGVITSDARIRAALPTIRHAMDAGAKVALCSHLGRPKGQRDPQYSLEPVGARLSELLERDVLLADDCIGDGVRTMASRMQMDAPVLLENLRFHGGETSNDPAFARALAAPFDTFINDAFGACHRAHASIVGVVPHVEQVAAGFLLEKEVQALGRLLENPERPFVAVVGGAKVSDKLGVLQALLTRVDTLCIGGAMAYTFLKAKDGQVGDSRVEKDKLRVAREVMERAQAREVRLVLPVDHVVAGRFDENAKPEGVDNVDIPEGRMGLDIGPQSRERLATYLGAAKTVFWNGPMGVFEWKAFAAGTRAVAEAVAQTEAYTVVGGGDSVAAVEEMGVADSVDHISTGGGASLELIEKGTLPGLDVLRVDAGRGQR